MPVAVGAASVFTTRKVVTYGVFSTLAALAVILGAFRQRSNFYSAAVMLGRSNGCMMVLFNFGLFLTLCFGKVCQKVFFGPLRPVEVEHLYERSWYAITESLLAMTIFRDEFGAFCAVLFGILFFLKVFHWLSADRVELMEQSPSVSRLFHFRMVSVLWQLFLLDLFLVGFVVEVLILDKNRMGIMLMFASEFVILLATLISTTAKYAINVNDMMSDEPWEAKSMWVFFVDLITDFLKLLTYLTFLSLILSFYGLPLNIIRDVYMTARSFFGKLRDFYQYRMATKNMDTRFPDATRQDLTVMSDGTCIICREEMVARGDNGRTEADDAAGSASASRDNPGGSNGGGGGLNETPKKLPCGHVFHFHCLRSWLERQQSCPTCRRTVFSSPDPQQNNGSGDSSAERVERAGRRAGDAGRGGDGQEGAGSNATHASMARMQRYLQQLQADAQRGREQADDQQRLRAGAIPPEASTSRSQTDTASRLPTAATTSTASTTAPAGPSHSPASSQSTAGTTASDSSTTPRGRTPVPRALISAIFSRSESPSGRSTRMEEGSGAATPIVEPAGQTDEMDDLISSLVPPPPWTFSPTRSAVIPPPASSPSHLQTQATETASASSEPTVAKEAEGAEVTADPVDAREAARAAALKRFERSSPAAAAAAIPPSASLSSTPVNSEQVRKGGEGEQQRAQTTRPSLPSDPHLIPLFDTTMIADYENQFARHLQIPLLNQHATNTAPTREARRMAGGRDELEEMALDSSLHLGPDQMRTLSRRNQKGLEERLRLLTRVEGAISGLVDDLTRALSVLPSSDDVQEGDEEEEESVKIEEAGQEGRPDKGKGAAEGVHAAPADSA